jgi:hypothetical protein
VDLRPLGFGEIFDRAVTLYIRNFVPIAAINMVLVVPLAIFGYILDVASQPQFDAMIRVFENPALARTQHIPTIFDSPGITAIAVVMLLVSYTIAPFVMNAVAVGVARLYRGRPVQFRACYEIVLRRWAQIVGMLAIELVVFLGWYVAVMVMAMVMVLVGAALGAYAPPLAFAFSITTVLLVFGLMLVLLAPVAVALAFAMYGVVIEERAVVASLVAGFARVFNRAEFWRSLLFAIAAAAIVLGGSTMLSMISAAAAIVHLPVLEATVQVISDAVITPFGAVLLAVYYFDVRIRREAYDLEAGLERLGAIQPA